MTAPLSRVYPIKIPFSLLTPLGPVQRFVFSFLIAIGKSLVLIDAGVSGSEERIFGKIQEIGRKPEAIRLLILTHSHPDHIGGARSIQEATGCVVAAHPFEQRWIEDTKCQERERPVPGFSGLVGGPVAVTRLIHDGELIGLGEGRALEVLHTPGHSAGSISLMLHPEMVVFSGDTIPVPDTAPIYDDPKATLLSIQRLMNIDQVTYLLPSWDEPHEGKEAYRVMQEGYVWVERVSKAVRDMSEAYPGIEPLRLTQIVVKELGLPPDAANPMVTRTIIGLLPEGLKDFRKNPS